MPTPTPIPLAVLDLKSMLIQSEDLTLGGLYDVANLADCEPPSNPDAIFWIYFRIDPPKEIPTEFAYIGANSCEGSGIAVAEKLFIEEDVRRAVRLAETAKAWLEIQMGNFCCTYTTETVDMAAQPISAIRGDLPIEYSFLVAQYEEAVLVLYIVNPQKFTVQDIAEIVDAALSRISAAQYPSD